MHIYLQAQGVLGKTSCAKVLARAINCLNPKDGEPCNECEMCKEALNSSLIDFVEMDAASNNSVDDIRQIRDEVNFLPTKAKYKIYIIDEVHMLSIGAFNALLKTLEEPPEHVKFILATTEPQKLPATILSRCQRFDFKRIEEKYICENLIKICKECKIKYDDEAINLIAELAEGGMRDSLSILERCAEYSDNNLTVNAIKELIGIPKAETISAITMTIIDKDENKALELVKSVVDDGKDISYIIFEIIKYIRDMLMYMSSKSLPQIYNENDQKVMDTIIAKTNKEELLSIIFELSKLANDVKMSSQKSLIFEVGILKLCYKQVESNPPQKHIVVEKQPTKEDKPVENKNEININTEEIKINIKKDEIKEADNKPKAQPVSDLEPPPFSEDDIPPIPPEYDVKPEAKPEPKQEKTLGKQVIQGLKEAGLSMVAQWLVGTTFTKTSDNIVEIEGINSIGKDIIKKKENFDKLTEIVSKECGNTMVVKIVDKKSPEKKQDSNTSALSDLGIDVNIIDE